MNRQAKKPRPSTTQAESRGLFVLFGFLLPLLTCFPPRQSKQFLSYFAERYIPLIGGYRRVVGFVGETCERA